MRTLQAGDPWESVYRKLNITPASKVPLTPSESGGAAAAAGGATTGVSGRATTGADAGMAPECLLCMGEEDERVHQPAALWQI
jgi:hypothetical protein